LVDILSVEENASADLYEGELSADRFLEQRMADPQKGRCLTRIH